MFYKIFSVCESLKILWVNVVVDICRKGEVCSRQPYRVYINSGVNGSVGSFKCSGYDRFCTHDQ
jgi:hypothetical protein